MQTPEELPPLPPISTKRKVIGVLLIIFGLFAFVTPFTPGAWLGLVGLEFLGIQTIWGKRIIHFFKKRMPASLRKMIFLKAELP